MLVEMRFFLWKLSTVECMVAAVNRARCSTSKRWYNVFNYLVMSSSDRLRVFTWHVHGAYLYYLAHTDVDFFIPVREERTEGYYGRGESYPFGDNVFEIPFEEVRNHRFDIILYQSEKNYTVDRWEVLSEEQLTLPAIYLEHNTPLESVTDQLHPLKEEASLLVHVTHYNQLMWKHQTGRQRVIVHGVPDLGYQYSGAMAKGLVLINHIRERGRVAGWDIYQTMAESLPIDIVGMGSENYGGMGDKRYPELHDFISDYRFLFNPMRYTSFGLAVCEAMMAGLPIVSLATTEYAKHIMNGVNGYVSNDLHWLQTKMELLLEDRELASELGKRARNYALTHFNIERFSQEWEQTLISESKSNYHEQDCIY